MSILLKEDKFYKVTLAIAIIMFIASFIISEIDMSGSTFEVVSRSASKTIYHDTITDTMWIKDTGVFKQKVQIVDINGRPMYYKDYVNK